jgi:hypothetical protein
MPWTISSPMDLKTQFIADYLRQTQSITDLCLHYSISRKLLISGSIATSKRALPVLMTAPESPSPALIRLRPTPPKPYLKPDAVTPPGR